MSEREAELRLALVCYGGVSLAVYMYGVATEFYKLLVAAREFDGRAEERRGGGTERVYLDALTDIAAGGQRLVVSIDIIGGTSAGGINGIALSKAIARNASLAPLKKVWIDDGDIRKLLRGTRLLGLTLQVAATVARQSLRLLGNSSPLRGEYMSKLLFTALTDMDKEGGSTADSLMPDIEAGLELYVPTTDLDGFDVIVASGAGGASNRDRDYRQVLVFGDVEGNLEQFGPDYTADLAFAGRATASFPGAFAPVSQESFGDEIGKRRRKNVELHPETVFLRQYDPTRAAGVYFVDGGVLDNAPFDLVIDAIARRSAQRRVFRRLVYVEPDPGQELYSKAVDRAAKKKRRWLKDLLAVSSVRGSHPILTDLTRLRDMNWRIAEVAAIAEQQENDIEKRTKAVLCEMVPANMQRSIQSADGAPTLTQLVEVLTTDGDQESGDDLIRGVSDHVYADAENSIGPAFPTYQRLKFEAVLKRLADGINLYLVFPQSSAKAGFVAAAWIEWARTHDAWQAGNIEALGAMLRKTDMPYRERRLMFILSKINELYDVKDGWQPPIEDLNELKSAAWTMIGDIRDATISAVDQIGAAHQLKFLEISDEDAVTCSPRDFANRAGNPQRFQEVFDFYGTGLADACQDSAALLSTFRRCTRNWEPSVADSLLNRYLGFALWDAILFPTFSLSDLPQLSPIPVAQFSPLTAKGLRPPVQERKGLRPPKPCETAPAKLKGIGFHHFAGFFAAKSRENDYLWGRLDAAEQILRMLAKVADEKFPDDQAPPHLAAALQAILDSETGLKRVKDLRKYLAAEVDRISANRTAPSPMV
jgi:patatin-related protein